jgi:Ca2+-binding EF-hand superfamily protein
MTTVVINENSLQAKHLVNYLRTLPFAEIREEKAKTQSVWDKAIAEGAVTVDEFIGDLKVRIAKWPDDNA